MTIFKWIMICTNSRRASQNIERQVQNGQALDGNHRTSLAKKVLSLESFRKLFSEKVKRFEFERCTLPQGRWPTELSIWLRFTKCGNSGGNSHTPPRTRPSHWVSPGLCGGRRACTVRLEFASSSPPVFLLSRTQCAHSAWSSSFALGYWIYPCVCPTHTADQAQRILIYVILKCRSTTGNQSLVTSAILLQILFDPSAFQKQSKTELSVLVGGL